MCILHSSIALEERRLLLGKIYMRIHIVKHSAAGRPFGGHGMFLKDFVIIPKFVAWQPVSAEYWWWILSFVCERRFSCIPSLTNFGKSSVRPYRILKTHYYQDWFKQKQQDVFLLAMHLCSNALNHFMLFARLLFNVTQFESLQKILFYIW